MVLWTSYSLPYLVAGSLCTFCAVVSHLVGQYLRVVCFDRVSLMVARDSVGMCRSNPCCVCIISYSAAEAQHFRLTAVGIAKAEILAGNGRNIWLCQDP